MSKIYYEIVHSAPASKDFSKEELIEISEQLLERNNRLGITGSLVYHNREFFQILEGEKDILLNLMDTVKDDTRHGNVHVVWESEIPINNISSWGFSIKNKPFLGELYKNYIEVLELKSTGLKLFDEMTSIL